jgi:hypothetical protein
MALKSPRNVTRKPRSAKHGRPLKTGCYIFEGQEFENTSWPRDAAERKQDGCNSKALAPQSCSAFTARHSTPTAQEHK